MSKSSANPINNNVLMLCVTAIVLFTFSGVICITMIIPEGDSRGAGLTAILIAQLPATVGIIINYAKSAQIEANTTKLLNGGGRANVVNGMEDYYGGPHTPNVTATVNDTPTPEV